MQNSNIKEIIIVEDFISKQYQSFIKDLIENSVLSFHYNFDSVLGHETNYPKDNVIEYPQFTHGLVNKAEIASDWWSKIEPIMFNFVAKTGIIYSNLEKCKINLNPKIEIAKPNQHFTIHRDFLENGFTAIYYINDSDGDTLFFNDTGTEVLERISPKQGTMVYFDNRIPHAGQPPKINNYRAVISFNWI